VVNLPFSYTTAPNPSPPPNNTNDDENDDRTVVNVGTGAVLGLFAGFVLARKSRVDLAESVYTACGPSFATPVSTSDASSASGPPQPNSNPHRLILLNPITVNSFPPLLHETGTGHGRSLVTSMGVGWGVGASWVRCSQDFEKEEL
jgi:hypothetical protein